MLLSLLGLLLPQNLVAVALGWMLVAGGLCASRQSTAEHELRPENTCDIEQGAWSRIVFFFSLILLIASFEKTHNSQSAFKTQSTVRRLSKI